jgi:hypothetical protein
MSDEGRGPGWWLVSDGKWYAPDAVIADQQRAELADDGPVLRRVPANVRCRSGRREAQ